MLQIKKAWGQNSYAKIQKSEALIQIQKFICKNSKIRGLNTNSKIHMQKSKKKIACKISKNSPLQYKITKWSKKFEQRPINLIQKVPLTSIFSKDTEYGGEIQNGANLPKMRGSQLQTYSKNNRSDMMQNAIVQRSK